MTTNRKSKTRTGVAAWRVEAENVFAGDGSPRIAEQIKRDIAAALQRAYSEGRAAMLYEARERVLREHRSILEGMRQALDAKARTIEIELAELGSGADSEG